MNLPSLNSLLPALCLTFVGVAVRANDVPPPASENANTTAVIPPTLSQPAAAPTPSVFVPPAESAIPNNEFGQLVRLGKQIFDNPSRFAKAYVGNSLRCSSCHLDAGRKANSAPLWAAYVRYPAYRSCPWSSTSVNVIGNCIATVVVAKWEGEYPEKRPLAVS
jgi:cytochrome c